MSYDGFNSYELQRIASSTSRRERVRAPRNQDKRNGEQKQQQQHQPRIYWKIGITWSDASVIRLVWSMWLATAHTFINRWLTKLRHSLGNPLDLFSHFHLFSTFLFRPSFHHLFVQHLAFSTLHFIIKKKKKLFRWLLSIIYDDGHYFYVCIHHSTRGHFMQS